MLQKNWLFPKNDNVRKILIISNLSGRYYAIVCRQVLRCRSKGLTSHPDKEILYGTERTETASD